MTRRVMTAVVAVLALVAHGARAESPKLDPASPRGAAGAMFAAMTSGDVAAAKALATGSDRQIALLDVIVPMTNSVKALETAAVKKFGPDGRKVLEGKGGSPAPSLDMTQELAGATEQVTGDTAVVTPVGADGVKRQPVELKRVEGQWKVDLAKMPTKEIDTPVARAMFKEMGELFLATAKEVDEGKYATPDAARQAIEQKMIPMVIKAAAAATRKPAAEADPAVPATTPAPK